MKITTKSRLLAAAICCAPVAAWADGIGPFVNGVATANPAEGAPANVLSSDFTATQVATGTDPLENPSGPIQSRAGKASKTLRALASSPSSRLGTAPADDNSSSWGSSDV